MPIYTYSRWRDGQPEKFVDRYYPITEDTPRTIEVDGEVYERDLKAEQGGRPHHPGNWPLECWSLGVRPSEIEKAKEHAKHHGLSIEFNKKGNPIITNKSEYLRYCRARGVDHLGYP